MTKRKVIVVLDINEDTISLEGLKHSIEQAFSKEDVEVDTVNSTFFKQGDEFSLTAAAIEGDVEDVLGNTDLEVTDELIVKVTNSVCNGETLGEVIGDAIDEEIGYLEREGEI